MRNTVRESSTVTSKSAPSSCFYVYRIARDVYSCTGRAVSLYVEGTLPRVSFSPESGGRVKPRRAMEEMRTQGTIRLKK